MAQLKREGHKLETQVPSEKAGRTKGMETKWENSTWICWLFIFKN